MYRSTIDDDDSRTEPATAGTYSDPVEAELARVNLEAHGIEAHVVDAASFNPILSAAVGGVRVDVRERDLSRARAILRERPSDLALDDGEGSEVVRCPRCELAYCFHERARITATSATVSLRFLLAPLIFLSKKRWHCHRCGFVWDDPKAGPAAMTALAPDDPVPVFRLRRAHPGMGLLLGVMVGLFVYVVVAALTAEGHRVSFAASLMSFFVVPVLGGLIGRSFGHDVCSEPSCRALLDRDREDCPRCHGTIAGRVSTAMEHYAASADIRIELAAIHKGEQGEVAAASTRKKAGRARRAAKPAGLPPTGA